MHREKTIVFTYTVFDFMIKTFSMFEQNMIRIILFDLTYDHEAWCFFVDEGKVQVVEDRAFDRFYNRSDGVSRLLLVLKNL